MGVTSSRPQLHRCPTSTCTGSGVALCVPAPRCLTPGGAPAAGTHNADTGSAGEESGSEAEAKRGSARYPHEEARATRSTAKATQNTGASQRWRVKKIVGGFVTPRVHISQYMYMYLTCTRTRGPVIPFQGGWFPNARGPAMGSGTITDRPAKGDTHLNGGENVYRKRSAPAAFPATTS